MERRGKERERERERLNHPNLDDLPEQTKDEVRPSLHDVLGSNVDDVASDGACRVEGQCLVLLHCEHVQLSLIDGSLVHSVGDRRVDQLAVSACENTRSCSHSYIQHVHCAHVYLKYNKHIIQLYTYIVHTHAVDL